MIRSRILAVIPAYNEAENLKSLIPELRRVASECDLVVINDGSTDGTESLLLELGCPTLRLPVNSGIGVAVQTGFLYSMRQDYDITLQVDGDGQHVPLEISHLVLPVAKGECDVAVGSRFAADTGYMASWPRRLGIGVMSLLIRVLTGRAIHDPTSGFRAFNRAATRFLAENYAEDYPEVESNLVLLVNGFRMKEIPVRMRPREHGVSSISSIKAFYYMLKVSLCLILVRLRGRNKSWTV